jgi:beta-lactamase class A
VDAPGAPEQTLHVTLQADVAGIVDGSPGVFGVYARNLTTGERVEIDADRVMPTESAAKTFVLVHYAALVAAGACDPDLRVALTDEHRLLGTGVLRYLASGLSPTLEDLAWLMIVVSDNVATAMLMGTIAMPADVNARMSQLGLPTARMTPDITLEKAMAGEPFATSTPHDLAEVYTHLDDRCRKILFRQQHLIGLPRRLPHAADAADLGFELPVRVYNKTGNGPGRFVDSGLFETAHASWVVAAMASEQPDFASRADDVAPTAFAGIGELVYQAWGEPPVA